MKAQNLQGTWAALDHPHAADLYCLYQMQEQKSRKTRHQCRIRVEIFKCTTGQVTAPRAAVTQPAWTRVALSLAVRAADGNDFRLDPAFRLHRPVSGQGWLPRQRCQTPRQPIPARHTEEMPGFWWEA